MKPNVIMKKRLIILMALSLGASAFAQNTPQPDAEYLLIRRQYKVNNDGSMDIRIRKEIKLLRNRAITAYADKGETFISYNPAFESLKINESYTLRADGSKVTTPENAFVNQLPGDCTDCGRLSGIRELAIIHTALEYNCTIVLDYTLHRKSTLLTEQFDFRQDCPVKRYEVRYADGRTQIENNLPQSVNDPYMPAKKDYDVEFVLGTAPSYTAEHSLPAARQLVASLKQGDAKATACAIRDWVYDYIHLNTVDPARTDYAMTQAAEVFASNCGTMTDKTGLLAAMLNEAGLKTEIENNARTIAIDRVRITLGDSCYFCSMRSKSPLVNCDRANALPMPIYVDRKLEWNPDTITENYVRIRLPRENMGLQINPAYLAPSRTSDVQASTASEFYHYTMQLPKGAKMVGGDVELSGSAPEVGNYNIIIKQKGTKLIITRSLRLRKSIITAKDYQNFRKIMIDWFSHQEIYFTL